jgi:uncharacterized protein (TIGR01777 family)
MGKTMKGHRKIFITGGLGFVGKKLAGLLAARGNSVCVVDRNPDKKLPLPENVTVIGADASKPGEWQDVLVAHDTVINLAGSSIFTRWNSRKKQGLYDSRILVTRNIVSALKKRKGKKTDFFSTSASGYYGFHGDEELTESDIPGIDFLARLCRDWEMEASLAQNHGARVVITRFGVVLGHGGGSMDTLKKIFRLRLGNRLGAGRQWFSWIHENDLASIFEFLLMKEKIQGPVNCTAPLPVTNRELTLALNRAMGTFPLVPPVPGFMLKILLGEFGDFILKGQKVVPKRLLEEGFTFSYPDLPSALNDLSG